MVFGGGRNSAIVSQADNKAATFGHDVSHSSPLKTLKRMGGKLKGHTAVTTTEAEPGANDQDRAAGTSVPVAERAKPGALNAGFNPPAPIRDDASTKGGRRSFSSFRSFRSRSSKAGPQTPKSRITGQDTPSASPAADGSTSGMQGGQKLDSDQVEAARVAQNPQDHLKKAGKDQSAANQEQEDNASKKKSQRNPNRIANTETFYNESSEQSEREQMVRQRLQNGTTPRANHPRHEGQSDQRDAGNEGAGATGTGAQGESREETPSEFVDAPDPAELQIGRTASQPSREAATSLSPRNRFIGSGGSRAGSANTSADPMNTPKSSQQNGDTYSANRNTPDGNASSISQFFGANGNGYRADGHTATHSASNLSLSSTTRYEGESFSDPRAASSEALGPNASGLGYAGAPPSNYVPSSHRTPSHATNTQESQTGRPSTDTNVDKSHSSQGDHKADKGGSQVEFGDKPADGEEESDSEYEEEQNKDEEEINIPEGSVPGLGIGDQDPKLPGERRPKEKKPSPSEDIEEDRARKKFQDHKDEVKEKRERQAEYAGWRQIGGWDKRVHDNTREESENLLERSTMLESYVNDKYLGDWYQNTAIIVFTAFFCWFLGRLRLSVSWISVVLIFSATAYRTSIRRMRRNYRDDILRQSLLERHAENDTESMEWLNSFMIKFWLIYEPSLSQMITEIGNEVLAEQTPGFIESIKLDKFTLGTKAPRIDFIRSFPRTNAQVVVIDMGASFTPNDTMDLTARQLQTKVNPRVQLGVRIGKGFLSKHMPVLLEDMNFKGKFRVRMKLMERPPHIQTLDFSFLAPPDFDFVLKPIGGDKLGFDINIIPGLSKFIKDMVNANLGPMLYAPNAFQVNIEQLMAGVGVNTGVGVLSIQLISADNLKIDADGRVDPYVMVLDKNKKKLAHSKIKSNTNSPVWNETINVIITNTNDNVLLEVYDFQDSAPDRSVGQVPIRINELTSSEAITASITSGGRKTGALKFVANYSPVTMPTEEDAEHGNSPRDTKSGILSVKVSGARNLDPTVSKTAKLSPFAEVEFSGRLTESTKVAKDTNNPEWNYNKEHIVMDKLSTLFAIRVRDHRTKIASPPQVGLFKMKLSQLLVEAEKGNKWFPLEDMKGEVKLELQWKPCNITVGGSANNYVEPIGVIRLHVLNGKNLRNLEHIGKIDPYVRAFIGHRLVARTDWFKNDLNPVWNQTLYLPVQNELQDMTIEVMDVENRGKDRSLGAFKVGLNNIIQQDENGNYKVFISDKVFTNKLMLPNRGPKGTLDYTIEFYPAIPIVSPEERDRIHADRKLIEILKKRINEQGGDVGKALSETERRELAAREERLDISGVDMPIEDQLQYENGVFAVAIVSLEGHRVGQSLKIVANNDPYPIFTTNEFKTSKRFSSHECADFVSGQMQLSSLRFELGTFSKKSGLSGLSDVTGGSKDEDAVAKDRNAAEITIGCHELIKEASLQPKVYEMQNGAKLELQARFFPLPGLVIDPSEDISDSGCIEIDLQRAEGVAPADPSGLSDPYCAFYMNNDSDKVYKSKIKKQTLDPEWNEVFRFAASNIKESFVKCIVNDWDMGNADDFLGGYKFDFAELEPLVWKDYTVGLQKIKKTREVKHEKEAPGTLYLRMRFLPGHLQKSDSGYLVGAASVTRAAGGLVNSGHAAAMGAAGAGLGVVGAAAHGPQALFNKLTHHGQAEQEKLEAALGSYSAQLESVTGIGSVKHDVQIRCFLLTDNGEKEVYRSHHLKVENGEITVTDEFNFKALPETELGVKVLAMKSLGRTSDIAQSSTDLDTGLKEIRLTKEAVMRISIAREDSSDNDD